MACVARGQAAVAALKHEEQDATLPPTAASSAAAAFDSAQQHAKPNAPTVWEAALQRMLRALGSLERTLLGTTAEQSGPVTRAEEDGAHGLQRLYLRLLVRPAQHLLQKRQFLWLVNLTTAVAVVTVGLSTYVEDPRQEWAQFADSAFAPLWCIDLTVRAPQRPARIRATALTLTCTLLRAHLLAHALLS